MMLTHLKITSAKAQAKPYRISDGQGLALLVQTNGSKLWCFRYRYGGRQKALHIGPWPTVSLADAREKCREARTAIANGFDPALGAAQLGLQQRSAALVAGRPNTGTSAPDFPA
jgi:hypothetical protein